jgi:hypothetical protein
MQGSKGKETIVEKVRRENRRNSENKKIPLCARKYYFVSVACCQVEVSATGRSLVQRSPTDCGVIGCDKET